MIGLKHVAGYLRQYLREPRSVLAHAQLTHPVLALFSLLDKAERRP